MHNVNIAQRVAGITRRSLRLAEEAGAQRVANTLSLLYEKVSSPQIHICFAGRTSTGKTTLIHTLLGRQVFPAGADPTTAVVTEVRNSTSGIRKTLALTEFGELRELTAAQFLDLCSDPEGTSRLILEEPGLPSGLRARIFDTPGYDSVYERHSEVLNDFIPQADYLVLTTLHNTGITTADAAFCQTLHDVFGSELPPVVLVVNRAPEDLVGRDHRVERMASEVGRLVGRPVTTFVVRHIDTERADGTVVSADAQALWAYLAQQSGAPERQQLFAESCMMVLESALASLSDNLDYQAELTRASGDDLEEFRSALNDLRLRQREVRLHMEQRTRQIEDLLKANLETQQAAVKSACHAAIDESDKWKHEDECKAFLTSHVLPREAAVAARALAQLAYAEIELLDAEVADMANTALGNFHRRIELSFDKFERLKVNLARKLLEQEVRQVAFRFLGRIGGRGGVGAGVANLAKMGLKRVGAIVGKTFSRQTHNAMAQFLARIGATSTRAVGAAIAVLIEVGIYVYTALTWQQKLKNRTNESVAAWVQELTPQVRAEVRRATAETLAALAVAYDTEARDLEEALSLLAAGERPREQLDDWRWRVQALRRDCTDLGAEFK